MRRFAQSSAKAAQVRSPKPHTRTHTPVLLRAHGCHGCRLLRLREAPACSGAALVPPALCRSLHSLVPLLVFESNSYRCGRGFWVQRRPMLHAHVTNEAPVHSQPWTTTAPGHPVCPSALCCSASLIRWPRLVSQMAAMAAAVGAAAAAAHSCESIVYVLIPPKHHTAHRTRQFIALETRRSTALTPSSLPAALPTEARTCLGNDSPGSLSAPHH